MSAEIIASLIALMGVVLSVSASLFVSLRATNTELEKFWSYF